MRGERKKFGDILVDLQVLSPAQVERVLAALHKRRDNVKFGEMARALGMLHDEHILAALAVQLQLLPGIEDLSVRRILTSLQGLEPARPGLAPLPR